MIRFLRCCAVVVLVVLLAAGTAYLVHGLHGAHEVAAAKQRAATDLAAALPAGERRAADDRRRARPGIHRLGRPSYSWQELRCDLATEDAGWTVETYVQECRISSVALVPTAEATPGRCEYLGLAGDAAGSSSPPAQVFRGTASALAADDPLTYCPDGVVAPPRIGVGRLLSGHRPADLGASPGWFVVVVDTDVSRSELGCDPWAIVFCTAPVDRVVLDAG